MVAHSWMPIYGNFAVRHSVLRYIQLSIQKDLPRACLEEIFQVWVTLTPLLAREEED